MWELILLYSPATAPEKGWHVVDDDDYNQSVGNP
jgi:hypothetical protein